MSKRTRLSEADYRNFMEDFVDNFEGSKKYSWHQLNKFYHWVKEIDLRFKDVLTRVSMNYTSLPPLQKIYDACKPVIDHINADEAEFERKKMLENNTEMCVWCGNGGTVNFESKKTGYGGAARCFCPFGDKLSKKIPQFNPDDKETWNPDKLAIFKHDFKGAYEFHKEIGFEAGELLDRYYETGVRPDYTLSDIMESLKTGELKESKKKGDK